jgi:hypothetical protein
MALTLARNPDRPDPRLDDAATGVDPAPANASIDVTVTAIRVRAGNPLR